MLPAFDPRPWGTEDLSPIYPNHRFEKKIGEAWLSGDDCRVASGPLAGKTLAELSTKYQRELVGEAARDAARFPLLLKFLFPHEKLSVQVHPDDWLAKKYGQPRGKTECWYALAAEPGAQVAVGLESGVKLEDVRAGIQNGTLENSLHLLPVAEHDMVYVDAGTVHAIWPGSILLETQQNSDITYRMYDYGRPRELHIDKSLEAARLATRAGKISPRTLPDRTILIDEDYFRIERIPVLASRSSDTLPGHEETDPGLSYLFAAAGTGRLTSVGFGSLDLPARGIVAVPASSPVFAVQDLGGLDLIRLSPRWPAG